MPRSIFTYFQPSPSESRHRMGRRSLYKYMRRAHSGMACGWHGAQGRPNLSWIRDLHFSSRLLAMAMRPQACATPIGHHDHPPCTSCLCSIDPNVPWPLTRLCGFRRCQCGGLRQLQPGAVGCTPGALGLACRVRAAHGGLQQAAAVDRRRGAGQGAACTQAPL